MIKTLIYFLAVSCALEDIYTSRCHETEMSFQAFWLPNFIIMTNINQPCCNSAVHDSCIVTKIF